MSDCDNCEEEEEENGQEQTYKAFMMAGELVVEIEAESSEEAQDGAERLWDKALSDVEGLSDDERWSVGLK